MTERSNRIEEIVRMSDLALGETGLLSDEERYLLGVELKARSEAEVARISRIVEALLALAFGLFILPLGLVAARMLHWPIWTAMLAVGASSLVYGIVRFLQELQKGEGMASCLERAPERE